MACRVDRRGAQSPGRRSRPARRERQRRRAIGKYGIASLTAAMLTNGAGSRSALEVAHAVDFLGADLTAQSGITRQPSCSTRQWLGWRRRFRSCPTSRRDRHFRKTTWSGFASSGSRVSCRRATAPRRSSSSDWQRAVRHHAPLRHADDGHGRHHQGLHHRRPPRVRRRDVPSGQRHHCGGRRRHTQRDHAASRVEPRQMEGDRHRGRARPPACTARSQRARGLSRRHARSAAVTNPYRCGWRRALDTGLLSGSGNEHDSRRVVRVGSSA